QSLAQRELAQRVWRTAEAALSPDAFTALWLVYTEGASPREAAHAIGRSPGATRVLLHRARKTLRESLDASDATSTQAVSHMADDVSPHGQASLGATP
ncbi:MAG: sigma factor-like helix-turn-helix DNA-binding protein, partial [Planctomycetota bacterium]